MKPALGPPGSRDPKVSRVTGAWKVIAGWLAAVQRRLEPSTPWMAQEGQRAAGRLLSHDWHHLGSNRHAKALQDW
eukprot:3440467-Karenia_brevis.AAC.1